MKPAFTKLVFFTVLLFQINPLPCSASDFLVLDGVIEPSLIVRVGSPVSGVLESVMVDRGDLVQKGQVIAELQSGVERASLDLAEARAGMDSSVRAREARHEFNLRKEKRFEGLAKNAVISFEDLDEARTNSLISMLELEEARDNQTLARLDLNRSMEVVRRMTILSPINGVVMSRSLTAGEYVENQTIVQLARIDPLHVEVFAHVTLLDRIHSGMKAEIRPAVYEGVVYEARVKVVDRVVDAASGTFGVRLELPNPDYSLPAGLKCRVTFINEQD